MSRTRFSPPAAFSHGIENVRGLLLAAVLKTESIKLLLGCTSEEAQMFSEESRGRLHDLKRRVEAARRMP